MTGKIIKRIIQISSLFLLVLLQSQYSSADDTAVYGNGINVFPVTISEIQLVSETIKLKYDSSKYSSAWSVDVTLNFKNEGPDTIIQMGFPFDAEHFDHNEEMIPPDPGFVTYVNGKKIPVKLKKGITNPDLKDIQYPYIFTSKVSFKRGEKKSIRHTYTVGGTSDSIGGMEFKYILKTGALWKGVIKRVEVVLITSEQDIDNLQCMSPRPQKFDRKGKDLILSWVLLNIEPNSDIVIKKFVDGVSKMSSDELTEEIMDNVDGCDYQPDQSEYFRNKVLATYGYPFSSPLERAMFYENGQFRENPNFSWANISKNHLTVLNCLNDNSEERITIPVSDVPQQTTINENFTIQKPWFQTAVLIGIIALIIVFLVLFFILKRRKNQK